MWKNTIRILIGKNKTSIFVFPCATSIVLSYYLLNGLFITHPRYEIRTAIVAVLVLVFWCGMFLFDQIKTNKGAGRIYIQASILPMLVMALFVGGFIACAVWGAGYLSLVPYERVDNGTQHIDALFHSTIAESYKHFPYASTLLNGEEYLPYHTFSHMIMGNVSRVMGMPTLVTYCFLYPVIFCPLHTFVMLFAIACAKNYFEGKFEVSFLDAVIMSLFVSGFLPSLILRRYGIWKTSYILSESFMIGNILAFLGYGVSFYAMKEWKNDNKKMMIFRCLLIPAFIFFSSWSKISVGFVFTTSILYYVFRTKLKDWRFWILNVVYFVVFMISFYLFNSSASGRSTQASIKIKAFEDYCSGLLGIWGHYLILLIMPVMFIGLDIARNHYKREDFIAAKTVWIEDMAIVCLVAFLPAFFLIVDGGSAAYFSYVCEVPALVILCGRNYLDAKAKGYLKSLLCIVCFCWSVFNAYINRSLVPTNLITNKHMTNLSEMLLEIRDRVGSDAKRYSIYLDRDSTVTQVFSTGMTSSYVCPAMTGVGVINASYYQDVNCYSYLGEQVSNAYAMSYTDNEGFLTFDGAINKAGEMGKEWLIHINNKGYEIIDIN